MHGLKHFFQNPVEGAKGLTIRGIGIGEEMLPSMIQRPTGTGDFLFMHFSLPVSVGVDRWDLQKHSPLQDNFFVLWTKGYPQIYGNPAAAFRHSWIHMDGPVLARLLRRIDFPVNVPVSFSDTAGVDRHLGQIYAEVTRVGGTDGELVLLLLEVFLRDVARGAREAERGTSASAIPAKLQRVRQTMEVDFATKWSLPQLAAAAGMSVSHFSAEFRLHFGASPMSFLLQQRLQHATRLLRDSGVRISEVSLQCGYEDLYQFSKIFRKHLGKSPRLWRKA